MAIKFGANSLSKAYKGASEVQKVYLGGNLLYQLLSDIRGEEVYTTAGTYQWTAPEGVTSVSVVAIGGGASGGVSIMSGSGSTSPNGGGGALAWKNNISVVPGQTYTVVVGAGGESVTRTSFSGSNSGNNGQDSYFISTSTVRAGGGLLSDTEQSTFLGDGGGLGGLGSRSRNSLETHSVRIAGGGGAGGYTGSGGRAGGGFLQVSPVENITITPTNGDGGGGAGGNFLTDSFGTGGQGGGTGIYGAGISGLTTSLDGQSGSGGDTTNPQSNPVTKLYGAGGASRSLTSGPVTSSPGQGGAVRIVWGENRAFPSTDVGITE